MEITRKELLLTNKEVKPDSPSNSRNCGCTDSETDYIVLHKSSSTFVSDKLKGGATGWQEEIRMDKAFILMRKLTLQDDYLEEIKVQGSCLGIHFVLEGSYEYKRNGDSLKMNIPSGSYIILPWSEDHLGLQVSGENVVALEIFLQEGFLEELLGTAYNVNSFGFSPNTAKFCGKKNKPIAMRLQWTIGEILDCNLSSNAKVNYVESKIRLLLIDLFLGQETQIKRDRELLLSETDYETIQNLVHYIETHLKNPLTIKELSAVVGFNTTKLKSYFKKVHGTTIFKYITQLRMEKAKTLILVDNYTIAQAAYEVGYSNPQHFTVAFKKTMGCLPSSLMGTDQ